MKRLLTSVLILTAVAMALTPVAADTPAAVDGRFTLVIDAGHGGKDAGALGKKSKEKDINLKVALAFGSLVERLMPDVRVVYTRKTDVFVELDERADIANRAKADLFISIHTNALPKGKIARGFETYTLGMHRAADNLEVAKRENSVILVESNYEQRYKGFDPASSESYIIFELMQDQYMQQSVDLARMVQTEVCTTARRPDKGVHQAGFLVLRATSMPGCLIELGFITTADEETLLTSDRGVADHARGIYNAFARYVKKYAATTSATAAPTTATTSATVGAGSNSTPTPTAAPVFKVQIMAVNRPLSAGDKLFKGETDIDCYEEGGMYKYTIGASTDYNAIYRLRKQLTGKFPEAFIIAFKEGQKTDVQQAIQEYKNNK